MTTLTVEEQQLRGQEALFELARRYFQDVLHFVQISEPGVGMIPMEQWPHLQELNQSLDTERLLVLAKCRQVGFTTDLSAYALWHSMYVPNALVVIFSKGERDAWDFLEKSRATYDALPSSVQRPLGSPDNRENMSFQGGGRITAMPSTKDAGRGLNPTLVIMDEADYHEYLDECYNSVKPGLDDRGGQLVLASTVNPYKLGGLFQSTYQNAPANGFKKLFFGWRVRPGRDDEWYQARKKEYQDQALFQKEFPETEEEAFAPARAISAFDPEVLTRMKALVREPLRLATMGNGVQANIYREFQPGRRYAAATDTSHGTGNDYAVTAVADTVTLEVVADIYSAVLNPFQLGVASVELLNMYGTPIWGIEDNDWGINTINAAEDLRYKRLYHRENGAVGWHTYDTQGHARGGRYQVWGDLIESINTNQWTIPNAEGLAQFFTVIRNPAHGKHGRIEAQQGAHDDYPMMLAILYQLKEFARPAAGDRGKTNEITRFDSLEPAGRDRLRWNTW